MHSLDWIAVERPKRKQANLSNEDLEKPVWRDATLTLSSKSIVNLRFRRSNKRGQQTSGCPLPAIQKTSTFPLVLGSSSWLPHWPAESRPAADL